MKSLTFQFLILNSLTYFSFGLTTFDKNSAISVGGVQQRPDFAKISKLRALFFPEFYKKFDKPLEVICSGNVVLDISTKKCSCEKHICSRKTLNALRRIIDTSCDDFCCRKNVTNFEKQIQSRQIQNLDNFSIDDDDDENKCGMIDLSNNRNPKNLFSSFPWIVKISSPMSQICVGTLIHPNIVMTTAVCIFMQAAEDLTVDIKDFKNNKKEQYKVEEIVIHEKFSRYFEKLDYNIALLVLNRSIEQTHKLNTVCLAEFGKMPNIPLNRQNCFVSSWEYEKSKHSFSQQTESFYVIPNNRCSDSHRSYRSKYEYYFHDGNICAACSIKSPKQMTYSGAPLICSTIDKTQYVQHGMLAWSTKVNKSPHIFTNVTKFVSWVENKIQDLRFDKSLYNKYV